MDWLAKIPNWIKIPVKILLPALAIFSGFIVLASDNVLQYLNLLEFEKKNGFAFSIIFLICVSLIICYIGSYVIDIIAKQLKKYIFKRNKYKQFNDLPDIYKNTLIQIYRQPTKSMKMDMSSSISGYLMGIKAIGTSGISEFGCVFDCYLQPWVVMCVEMLIKENKKYINIMEKLLPKIKNDNGKKKMQNELKICKENLGYLTTIDESMN